MLNIQRYNDLGHADHGWLNAHFHFSFADYYNPKRMGFGPLRVINDDIVQAGGGFPPHPHRDMEIITYVRAGAITHEDSLGNQGKTAAGDIQVMSAGSGITHAEWNAENVATRLYQIWIHPRTQNAKPRWEAKQFPKAPGALHLLASGREADGANGALWIDADAALWGGVLNAGHAWTQPLPPKGGAYLLVSRGEVALDDAVLKAGDGAEISAEVALALRAVTEAELVVIVLEKLTQQ